MSSKHDWFISSKSSKSSPKRSWYIWKSPQGFTPSGDPIPPNNWAALLGEANSAWTYDSETKEYYLSLFTPEQPDLNWENTEVREAVYDLMQFWLDKGVRGFRMDVISCISKDQSFPDAQIEDPKAPFQQGAKYFINGPRFHEFVQEMNKEVLSKYDALAVGESSYSEDDIEEAFKQIDPARKELNMIFQFEYIHVDYPNGMGNRYHIEKSWGAKDLADITKHLHTVFTRPNAWLTQVLSNHDQPRDVSRFIIDKPTANEAPKTDEEEENRRVLGTKLLALMETTLGGTLFMYQGQELGMKNFPGHWGIEEYKDVASQNVYKKMLAIYANQGLNEAEIREKMKEVMRMLQKRARDHARTPMQWTDGVNAGFCAEGVTPWMKINEDYMICNAGSQVVKDDGMSAWQSWKRGLENRKKHKGAFVYGSYTSLPVDKELEDKVFAYLREGPANGEGESGGQKERWMVVLNFSSDEVDWQIPANLEVKSWVAGNYSSGKVDAMPMQGTIKLRAWEGLLSSCVV